MCVYTCVYMCVHVFVHVCTCVYMCVQVLKKTTEQADKNIEAVERETGRLRKGVAVGFGSSSS